MHYGVHCCSSCRPRGQRCKLVHGIIWSANAQPVWPSVAQCRAIFFRKARINNIASPTRLLGDVPTHTHRAMCMHPSQLRPSHIPPPPPRAPSALHDSSLHTQTLSAIPHPPLRPSHHTHTHTHNTTLPAFSVAPPTRPMKSLYPRCMYPTPLLFDSLHTYPQLPHSAPLRLAPFRSPFIPNNS